MWAFITGIFTALPTIDDITKRITGIFTKTPEEQSEEIEADTQKDENSIDKSGRPE